MTVPHDRLRAICAPDLRPGLDAIRNMFPHRFGGSGSTPVRFEKNGRLSAGGLSVERAGAGFVVRYGRRIDAFRALGRLMGALGTPEFGRPFAESPRFDRLGVMWDVSRNGVLRPAAARDLLARGALMGLNVFMLYAEDVYEVAGEPFFGYLRGAYTQTELRALDDHADALGIEMVPCIQTLAHLHQILKWPAYAALQDVPGVLMADDSATHALLEKMIRSATAPFRSRRLHLGMDEAHGLGTGNYLKRNGPRNPFDIFSGHLDRVRGICRKLGLQPMIWSDMYFRMASRNYDYFDTRFTFTPAIKRRIPRDVQMVYWDYYHTDEATYRRFIRHHRGLGVDPVLACGLWTWTRLWAQLPYTLRAADAGMQAAKREGVREAFTTAWFDDGNDADPFSALPGLQHFAEHGYADRVEPRRMRANFRGSCDADLDAWTRAGAMDCFHPLEPDDPPPLSVTRALLWDDPLLGLMDAQLAAPPPPSHYRRLAAFLDRAGGDPGLSARLGFPAAVARAVDRKYRLRRAVLSAYRGRDRTRVRALLRRALPETRLAVRLLWREHRRMWSATYKPFGFEVVEGRYGALLARLDHLEHRLRAFAMGEVSRLPELEANHHPVIAAYKLGYHPDITYAQVAVATCNR